LLKLLYSITHLETRVEVEGEHTHVHLTGVGTFLGIPKITQALEQVKNGCVVSVHGDGLRYIDHGCIEVIEGWAKQREQNGQEVHVEMEKLHLRFHTKVSQSVS